MKPKHVSLIDFSKFRDSIFVETFFGGNFFEVASEIISLSKQYDYFVCFEWNGTKVTASPYSTPDMLWNNFMISREG